MSLTKYEILLKAAECGSFTKAAQELNFTQSGDEAGGAQSRRRIPDGGWPGAAALFPADVRPPAPVGAEGRRSAGTGHRPCASGHLYQRVGEMDALHSEELPGAVPQDRI